MDDSTLGNMLGVGLGATMFAAYMGALIGANRTNRRGRRQAPILDREYGPKIKRNLVGLEIAVKSDDKKKAFEMLDERNTIINELNTLSPSYISESWTGFTFASDEVKKNVAAGAGLETYFEKTVKA